MPGNIAKYYANYSDAVTKKQQKNMLIFSDSVPSRVKIFDFNKALGKWESNHISFPGNTSKQLLQYLDVNLKIYTLETVVFHAGINDTLKYNITANQTPTTFLVILNA